MTSTQFACFACGARRAELPPGRERSVRTVVTVTLAAAWLVFVIFVLGLQFMQPGRQFLSFSVRFPANNRTTSGALPIGHPDSLSQRVISLIQSYEPKIDILLRDVERLRKRRSNQVKRSQELDPELDRAETQLCTTRRMVRALLVCSDTEAVRDVSEFLDRRLARTQSLLKGLSH